MKGKKPSKTQLALNSSDSDESQRGLLHEGIVSQVTEKIKNEPFLFVIATVALLVSFTPLATGLGSSDLRFVISIIALLAFAVIIGYYTSAGLQMRNRMRREEWKHEKRLRGTTGEQSAPNKVVASSSALTDIPKYDTWVPAARKEQLTALEQELSQYQRNLARLRSKKAVYAAGEEPLSLLNQIEIVERDIQRIEAELASLNRD